VLCWQVLDSNGSGGLTSQEFCAAMKKLVQFCSRFQYMHVMFFNI
jgi:hypothetical protein